MKIDGWDNEWEAFKKYIETKDRVPIPIIILTHTPKFINNSIKRTRSQTNVSDGTSLSCRSKTKSDFYLSPQNPSIPPAMPCEKKAIPRFGQDRNNPNCHQKIYNLSGLHSISSIPQVP
ncbi:MAG: hypothetical protein HZA50_03740 [Planctomycetes bacterium]|nr:hypothetical protein [Planctomycetota bacterium]